MTASTNVAGSYDGRGLIETIYRRHSVRAYKSDQIDDRRILELLDVAVTAPTAMHQEPCQFVVVQDRALLKRISDRAKELTFADALHHGNVLKRPGSAGDGKSSRDADPEFDIFYDAGTLVVIAAEVTNEFVTADCWLAAGTLMLAATAQGFGTCCIGSAVGALNLPQTKAELGIPTAVQAIAPLIIGLPQTDVPPTSRKPVNVIKWVR
jgi:nitroreductase